LSELQEMYDFIDKNLDKHISKIQEFVRQRSVSPTGEGIHDCASLLKRYFVDLGCHEARIVDDDYISPIVYAKYDAKAEKTLLIYMMYDTMPADEAEGWQVPPFEGKIVEWPPFKKVMMARGVYNTKGPLMAFINVCETIKTVAGELPVNLIFVAEGEEERGSVSLREKFVPTYAEELKQADAAFFPSMQQDATALTPVKGGSEGLIYFELETSGAKWGRGPQEFGIHGSQKLTVDSPAWRHIKMLSTLVADDGNRVLVDGWYDNVSPPGKEDLNLIKEAAKYYDLDAVRQERKVKVFVDGINDAEEYLKHHLFGTCLNLDGIWGGYIGAGPKTLLPHKVTSKHEVRLTARQEVDELVGKIRQHLDTHGYEDVEMRVLQGYSWARANYNSEIARAVIDTYKEFNVRYVLFPPVTGGEFSPAWPACAFSRPPLSLPLTLGGLGHGQRAHAPNEFMVLEGADGKYGRVHGLAECEKSYVSILHRYARESK
jgi:acetylornithine deacetylase/succinyl-diaminopimelate desuccinylase-like protein